MVICGGRRKTTHVRGDGTGLRDHALLPQVAAEFDVLVTIDRGFEHEHNLTKHGVGIVIVHAAKNKVEFYRAMADQLLSAIESVLPGSVIHVAAHGN